MIITKEQLRIKIEDILMHADTEGLHGNTLENLEDELVDELFEFLAEEAAS